MARTVRNQTRALLATTASALAMSFAAGCALEDDEDGSVLGYEAYVTSSGGTGTGPKPCTTNADCNDNVACTDDACVSSACRNTPVNARCNDNVSCTVDVCTGGGCTNTPNNSLCNDGVDCTIDVCTGTACTHSPDNSRCNDNNVCTVNVCDVSQGCKYPPDYGKIGSELDALRSAAAASFATEDGWRAGHTVPRQYWPAYNGPDPAGNACNATGTPMNCAYGISCNESTQRTGQAFSAVGPQCWSCGAETRHKEVRHWYGQGYQGCPWVAHDHPYNHTVEICSNAQTSQEYLWDNWNGRGSNGVSPSGFRTEYNLAGP